eukprot:TRINITY_DN54093_c0_g1_i1.p1 TRINITY_DN54093_c0_g1~~TRINITY_DN54093_c0_g1_i1.p1  ORF type:complete len:146 (+),score=11.44 TRINITY_DN54093_c0_g1_i1:31-438(+)
MGCGASSEPVAVKAREPALVLPIPADDLKAQGWHLRTITEGDGHTYPQRGDDVIIDFKGILVDGRNFGGGADLRKTIGVGKMIKGWDVGLLKMSKGEKAQLSVAPEYGYGSRGAPGIPPDSILLFEITLRDVIRN